MIIVMILDLDSSDSNEGHVRTNDSEISIILRVQIVQLPDYAHSYRPARLDFAGTLVQQDAHPAPNVMALFKNIEIH